tara:strand:+ start:25 stop:438 length:414 start_codon:yes stop_codon:yes gene_type:complete
MRLLLLSFALIFSYLGSASTLAADSSNLDLIDPNSIDPEMTSVMYLISPDDIKTTAYKSGAPSNFNLKLCKACQIKPYSLKIDAELLLNEQPLTINDLAIQLIKKQFDVIQLGIDRTTNTITYIYLGGISELSTGEL